MLDNYTDETMPLFRLLHTPAFRFVLVYFNHYSLRQRLKEDLQYRFPEWPVAEADATKVSYRELADTFYDLEKGLFFIDNFEGVLAEPEKYTGLNLRRDKLAQYPIALICFISPGAQTLVARDIMEKMPDLWSFRSEMLDLKMEIIVDRQLNTERDGLRNTVQTSSLGGYDFTEKKTELQRLQKQVVKTTPEESSLIEMLLLQIKDIQTDIGLYVEAIETVDILLKEYKQDKEAIAVLYIDKGDLLRTIGKSAEAVKAYESSLSVVANLHDNNNIIAIANERLGTAYADLGDLKQAMIYYQKYNQLEVQLHKAFPDNVEFKDGLAISYSKLGEVHLALGNLERALAYYLQYNQREAQLYKAYPENVDFKKGLAISFSKLGDVESSLGNFGIALAYYNQNKRLNTQLYHSYPDNVVFKNNLGASLSRLGDVQSSLGNLERSLGYYEQLNQLEAQLHHNYPDNVDFKNNLIVSFSKLGEVQLALGNLKQALVYYQQYNELGAKLHQAYPNNVVFKNNLAISLVKLGFVYRDSLDDREKALNYFKNAEQLWIELVKASPSHAEFNKFLTSIQQDMIVTESFFST